MNILSGAFQSVANYDQQTALKSTERRHKPGDITETKVFKHARML